MKRDIENQYDDDLTLGTDEYDDSYYTDADDLFQFSTNDESPISRLKSLVLSIDWEITDEVLLQFNEELIDLKGVWAGNSINLVYVQALEKISKYIYQNKANSHPNSIKLLLTLYYNLEKIVSSEDLSEAQKKDILVEDVKRFEALKRQISQKTKPVQGPPPARPPVEKMRDVTAEDKLLNLKAIVLGIDWEITDQDLNDLRREVLHLEEQFADSRPKLILLQGLGTLGTYIKTKKSNSHADAFKVLHLFYESLEKIVKSSKTFEEEKAILFPAVQKFNEFKALLGPTISPVAIEREEDDEEDEEFEESGSGEIAPALADVSDEETIGFQADEEAKSLGIDNSTVSHIDSFFGESVPPVAEGGEDYSTADSGGLLAKEETSAAGFDNAAGTSSVEKEMALQGVDVGADDEEEDAEDYQPGVAALADVDDDAVAEWKETSDDAAEGVVLAIDDEQPKSLVSEEEIANAADSLFPDTELPLHDDEHVSVDREVALQGVNVETEADEDTDEISLPMEGEEIAPALVASEEESMFSAETLEIRITEGLGEEIAGTLDDLFLEEVQFPAFPEAEKAIEEEALKETEVGDFHVEEQLFMEEPAGEIDPEHIEVSAADQQSELPDTAVAKEDDAIVTIKEEEDLGMFFTGSDLEQSAEESAEVDSLFESLEPALLEEPVSVEIDEQAQPFFGQEEHPEAGQEVPAAAVDEVTPAEEGIPLIKEEASPVEEISGEDSEEEITLIEDEVPPIEEEISLVEEPPAEEDFSIAGEEVVPTEEEVSLAEEFLEEEEVVFELANETEAEPVPVAPVAPTPEEHEFAFADEVAEDLPATFLETARDEGTLSFAPAELDSDRNNILSDPLAGLHDCIQSLGIELNDEILSGLFQEINALRQKWPNRPLEKNFLQLLSTIAQHIDCYRFEASSEAHNLLLSVYTALAGRREDDIHYCQELLLVETLKVLEWQQGMLTRQAVSKGTQSPFTAPVWSEGEDVESVVDARQDFDQLLQQYQEPAEEASFSTDEPLEATAEPLAGFSRESLATELKQEIASLRMTLQQEIAELRNELKGK